MHLNNNYTFPKVLFFSIHFFPFCFLCEKCAHDFKRAQRNTTKRIASIDAMNCIGKLNAKQRSTTFAEHFSANFRNNKLDARFVCSARLFWQDYILFSSSSLFIYMINNKYFFSYENNNKPNYLYIYIL